jgi:ribosomal-protein-alanine N-acetyltransferase
MQHRPVFVDERDIFLAECEPQPAAMKVAVFDLLEAGRIGAGLKPCKDTRMPHEHYPLLVWDNVGIEMEANSATVLHTQRLMLRDLHAGDVDRLVDFFAEPESHPYILGWQRNSELMRRFLRSSSARAGEPRKSFQFTIVCRESGVIIGSCSLSHATEGSRNAVLGWHLGRAFYGRGYATEIAAELLRFAFLDRDVQRVYGDCFEANTAAIRVFEKAGLEPERPHVFSRWLRALRYLERARIVRYEIEKGRWLAAAARR